MKINTTQIPGCFEIKIDHFEDSRGEFFKTYHLDRFKELGLDTNWHEEYFSTSKKNVVRGMHFQLPPDDHSKLVTCIRGAVLDVVLDLRKGSPSFKNCISFELNYENKKMIYIPKGCAHGFLSLQEDSLMFYKVSSVYSPSKDSGIRWDSINFDWPSGNIITSERDQKHPVLEDFNTPFN